MFLVVLRRSGPRWQSSQPVENQLQWAEHASYMERLVDAGFVLLGGPLEDGHRVVLVFDTTSKDAVLDLLGQDPWSGSVLAIESIDSWTIRLDARRSAADVPTPRMPTGGAGPGAP